MARPRCDIQTGIPEFYRGQTVLVTGFTGYIGSLLVEKLLYSCPQVRRIYALVRPKKGQDPQARVRQIIQSLAFTRLREKHAGLLESKVTAVGGDVSEPRLGLSPEDEQMLREEVTVIIHGAASVRFDEPIHLAIRMNTLGTKKVVDLALQMPHLKCLTYVSTAYTNCDHIHIKEEIYPPKADWRKTIEMIEKLKTEELETLQYKIIDRMPNTYVFTKSLAEQVINEHRDQLPVVIVRPSIVFPAVKEPEPGWTGNKYGPVGLVLGFFLGIVRCSWVDVTTKCNYIPCDIVINSVLIATWKTALTWDPKRVEDSVTVYNACSPNSFNLNHQKFSEIYKNDEIQEVVRRENIVFINLSFYPSETRFKWSNLYKHVLPAYIVDFILVLLHKKPLLVNIRRKVFAAACALSHFATRTFVFQTDQFDGLAVDLRPEDRAAFGWDFTQTSIARIYKDIHESLKKTFLKPLYDDLDGNRKKLRMLYIVDEGAVYLTFSLLAYTFYLFNLPQLIIAAFISFWTIQ